MQLADVGQRGPRVVDHPVRKRASVGMLIREPSSSGPLSLAPVSAKSSKNTRFSRQKRVFFELFCDTGAHGQRRPRVVDHPARKIRKVDIRLPGKGNSNSRGARPVYSFR